MATLSDFQKEMEEIASGKLPPVLQLLKLKAHRLGRHHPEVMALQSQYADDLRRRYGTAVLETADEMRQAARSVLQEALRK